MCRSGARRVTSTHPAPCAPRAEPDSPRIGLRVRHAGRQVGRIRQFPVRRRLPRSQRRRAHCRRAARFRRATPRLGHRSPWQPRTAEGCRWGAPSSRARPSSPARQQLLQHRRKPLHLVLDSLPAHKKRVVPVGTAAREALSRWLTERAGVVHDGGPGALRRRCGPPHRRAHDRAALPNLRRHHLRHRHALELFHLDGGGELREACDHAIGVEAIGRATCRLLEVGNAR